MYPECNRCARLGYKCTYRDRVSHRASQAAVIQQLQERMSQAEARLAQQGISLTPGTSSPTSKHQTIVATGFPPPPPSSSTSSVTGSIPRSALNHQPSKSPVDLAFSGSTSIASGLGRTGTGFDRFPVSMVQDTPTLADFDFATLNSTGFGHHQTTASEQGYGLVESLDIDLGTPTLDWSQIRTSTAEESPSSYHFRSVTLDGASNTITTEDLGALHQIFFHGFATAMPILYKDRFYRELRDNSDDLALKSVSYTISLLAILISDQHRHLESTCYALARRYIEACEIGDESNISRSITFFQSLLFLTRYELGRRNCTRASMLLGRAARLGKILRLDELDRKGNPSPTVSTGITAMPHAPLRPTQDVVEMEERRRCFWTWYILEGYSTIRTGALGSLNDGEIYVQLPSPGNLDSRFTPTKMPTLPQATSSIQDPEEMISPFTGLVLVTSLLRKVIQHTLATESINRSHHTGPGFWDRHYALMKDYNEYGRLLQHFSSLRVLYNDSVAFNIHLTFCAIELRLWDAALDEAEQSGLPNTLESMRQVHACALKIGNTVRSVWSLQRMACDSLSLSGAFVAWPICMAIKGLNRQIATEEQEGEHSKCGKTPQIPTGDMDKITLLQVLCAALDDFESPSGPWHESIAGFVNMGGFQGQRTTHLDH
ncbi:hypothetical protein V8F20_002851 [Naviculisporaceae sp. PSN 640]